MAPKVSKVRPYALIVNGEYLFPLWYPSQGDPVVEQMTAALQSDPTIKFLEDVPEANLCRYEVFVGDDFVDYLYYLKSGHTHVPPEAMNAALSSNPKVVPIPVDDSEGPINLDQKWSYDGVSFTPIV